MFAKVVSRNGYDPTESAALFGYHASVEWGVVADDEGIRVFNPHWLLKEDWYTLPKIHWADVAQHGNILDGFTPEALVSRQLSNVASRIEEPTGFLSPVDDALVDRLDRWREQALRYARNSFRVDDLLQTLYAQLFVLRTVEDRKLEADIPAVEQVLNGPEAIDWDLWDSLLGQARARIGSDLFENDVARSIPEHVVSGVIRDLYSPQRVPGRNARYDFSWIDADVLGLAYEKYLATVLHPISLPSQVDLFLPPEREVERRSVRKASGAYYTPKYITGYLSQKCVDKHFAKSADIEPPAVIDFACGSGSFLVAAVDKVLSHLRKRDAGRSWARELVDAGKVVGIDIDQKAVTAARLHLWQRLIEEPGALPLPSLASVIVVGDGLDRSTWGELDKKYDIVLGNPPFLATSHVESRDVLEARFQTAKGRYDFSSLFVEQAVNVLAPDGWLGLVVPNRLFRGRSGAPLRAMLSSQTNLATVVDFESTRPFDADAYVGCVVAQLDRGHGQRPDQVRVIQVKSLEAEFIAAILLLADSDGVSNRPDIVRSFMARRPDGDEPWLLLSEGDQIARIQIEEVSVRLDTIASIPQGIKTGANDLFIVDVESVDDAGLCRVRNGLGESFIIETGLIQSVIYGSQLRRFEKVFAPSRLIYPYKNGVPISEGELQSHYPHGWSYFSRNRSFLSSRMSLKKTNGRFYELVWPRDETWLRRPKLLIRDLAPRTAFAIDPTGETFLVGGTAVVPQDPEILWGLFAYLNSATINALVVQTTPQFRGSFQKFEPQHIQSIPILDRFIEDEHLVGHLGDLAQRICLTIDGSEERSALENAVNTLVAEAAAERGLNVDA